VMYKGEEGRKAYEENSGEKGNDGNMWLKDYVNATCAGLDKLAERGHKKVAPVPPFTDEVVCRGSMRIGNGCGKCAKCLRDINDMWREEAKPLPSGVGTLSQPVLNQGWQCPACGGVNSPSTSRCPCVPYTSVVTC